MANRGTFETLQDAIDTAKRYRCADCNQPGKLMLSGRKHVISRVHHNWCATGIYIHNNHPQLRRPFVEDIPEFRRNRISDRIA